MYSTTTNTRHSAGSVKSDKVANTSVFIKVLLSDGTLVEETQWECMEDLHIVLTNFHELDFEDKDGFLILERLELDGTRKIDEIHAITLDFLQEMGIAV